MISLDQVLLLQEKVETAVEKISVLGNENKQLKAENDALRQKCVELTNALSAKSELVSSLENQQQKIESCILSSLNRLDTVENTILTSTSGAPLSFTENGETNKPTETNSNQETIQNPVQVTVEEPVQEEVTSEEVNSEEIHAEEENTEEGVFAPEFSSESEPVIDIPTPGADASQPLSGNFDIF